MFSVGEKVVYGENGVCTVEKIAPLDSAGADPSKLYYHLTPYIGSGTYYNPVESGGFMRPVISRAEAEAVISAIPEIEPAICEDKRSNHISTFYRDVFRLHTPEAMVSIIKGLSKKVAESKSFGTRAEADIRRAKNILYGELSIALEMTVQEVESYIKERTGS